MQKLYLIAKQTDKKTTKLNEQQHCKSLHCGINKGLFYLVHCSAKQYNAAEFVELNKLIGYQLLVYLWGSNGELGIR